MNLACCGWPENLTANIIRSSHKEHFGPKGYDTGAIEGRNGAAGRHEPVTIGEEERSSSGDPDDEEATTSSPLPHAGLRAGPRRSAAGRALLSGSVEDEDAPDVRCANGIEGLAFGGGRTWRTGWPGADDALHVFVEMPAQNPSESDVPLHLQLPRDMEASIARARKRSRRAVRL
uniref:Uncharacterized protein n=1 Tax=Oryza barthii TaxID=65489 RepID=A0A0D3G0H5_9ORYZ